MRLAHLIALVLLTSCQSKMPPENGSPTTESVDRPSTTVIQAMNAGHADKTSLMLILESDTKSNLIVVVLANTSTKSIEIEPPFFSMDDGGLAITTNVRPVLTKSNGETLPWKCPTWIISSAPLKLEPGENRRYLFDIDACADLQPGKYLFHLTIYSTITESENKPKEVQVTSNKIVIEKL